ncbi:MAG: DUF547 domain-containing protein [Deltaproteobacteria bacterium]
MAGKINPFRTLVLVGVLVTAAFGMWESPAADSPVPKAAAKSTQGSFSYADYAAALRNYVDDHGLVNYGKLKANRKKLDAFAASIATLDPKVFDTWSEKEKLAFWINAYNALTLLAIIDNYPIQSSFFRSLRFPKNSIRQIAGVWDELEFPVMGRKLTLDKIEHDILRPKFNEPRIHMAIVCAALGCPILRNEPYVASKIDSQLNDQAARFMKNPRKFRIDRKDKRVYFSPIFKWFGDDFVPAYGTNKQFHGFGQTDRAVLNFVSGYVSPKDRQYLEKGGFSIEYLPYDWSLNERKG